MQQLLELLVRPFGFTDLEWLQHSSVLKRLAAFFSHATAGGEGASGTATKRETLQPQPWDELGEERLQVLLKLPPTATETARQGPQGQSSADTGLSVASRLLSYWEAATATASEPEKPYKLLLYRCEIAVLSRDRPKAETALQQVKETVQALKHQQLLQPQVHALFVAAEAYVVLGQPAKARASLQQAIQVARDCAAAEPLQQAEEMARAQLLLAELLLIDRQSAAAAAAVKEASQALGPTYKASELLARIAEKGKRLAEAETHYAEVWGPVSFIKHQHLLQHKEQTPFWLLRHRKLS